jgi:hypothetical protein
MPLMSTPEPTTSRPPISPAVWRLAAVIVFGAFMSTLDTSVGTVGQDRIGENLHSSLGTTQSVASGYLLALAAAMPVTGWLTRRVGTRPVWLTALALFTLVSAACALATTMDELIALRTARCRRGNAGPGGPNDPRARRRSFTNGARDEHCRHRRSPSPGRGTSPRRATHRLVMALAVPHQPANRAGRPDRRTSSGP